MSEVKEYLKNIVCFTKNAQKPNFKYCSIEEFVLKEGRFMGERSLGSNQCPKGEPKQCFQNAFRLATLADFIYCEGYALILDLFPVAHAWCIDPEGNVFDNTWDTGNEYYGVPFNIIFVKQTILKRKKYGVIDDWKNKWPLLRGEFSRDVFLHKGEKDEI